MTTLTALRGKDRSVWALFTDWCAAADLPPLPADPLTVAQFITENPAALPTQRRRVTTINAVHRAAEHPTPGSAESIRRTLNHARAQRFSLLAATAADVIDQLPSTGWTAGLFGRRDALLLLLAADGLSFGQISDLRRADLRVDGETLVLDVTHSITVDPLTARSSLAPAQVYRRWLQILEFQDRAPSTHLLASRLDTDTLPIDYLPRAMTDELVEQQQQSAPLFTPIDRWGHTPFARSPLSAHSIARIVEAHISGRSPGHRPHQRLSHSDERAETFSPEVILDYRYYESGLQARRTAHASLADVQETLDDVEARADEILKRLLAVLDAEV
ncbi:MAG: hypothetical protein WA988_20420 [Candidatus Nanopelagicales bacterium]